MAGAGSSEQVRPLEWLTEALAQRLAEALELMTGDLPQVAWRAAEPGGLPGELLWWEQPFSLGKQAVLAVGAAEASWSEVGAHVLRAAGVEQSEAADLRNTYLEILGQALSGLARDLSGRLGQEVNCEAGAAGAAPPAAEPLTAVDITITVERPLTLWVTATPALLEAVEQVRESGQALEAGAVTRPTSEAPQQPQLPPPVAAPPPSSGQKPKTLELLMEVEMPVSVSFGRAELPLRDVLKLTTGSIIELNRTITEPVEVIVNNCVIARGEVVVIEGNYGIRIQEIISRQERLRTLK